MPIPFQQASGLLYNVFDQLPLGVGYSRVFNNESFTLLDGKALNLDTDGARYADASLSLECHGFAYGDILPNTWGEMAHDSVIYLNDWFLATNPSTQYLTQGSKYYLSTNGDISLVPDLVFPQEIGLAVSIHELVIEIQTMGGGGALGPILAAIATLQTDVTTLQTTSMSKLVYDINADNVVDNSEMLAEQKDILPVTVFNQTAFAITKSPLQPMFSTMYVNGVIQNYGTDYTIIGTTLTYNPGFPSVPLDTTDQVVIIYR